MARRETRESTSREVYFEFVVIGATVKVSAIDADSGIEVVIMGPRSTSRAELERIALQKLRRAIDRKSA
jgi:tRNA nucleotidyltransferase (CCA-adding enzyme)